MQNSATNKWLVIMLGTTIQMICVGLIPWQLVWKLNSWNPTKHYKTKHLIKGERKNKEKRPKVQAKTSKTQSGSQIELFNIKSIFFKWFKLILWKKKFAEKNIFYNIKKLKVSSFCQIWFFHNNKNLSPKNHCHYILLVITPIQQIYIYESKVRQKQFLNPKK